MLYSGEPSVAEVPTSTKSIPAVLKTGLGAVDPRLDVAGTGGGDDAGDDVALDQVGFTCARMWLATAAPAVRFDWPT